MIFILIMFFTTNQSAGRRSRDIGSTFLQVNPAFLFLCTSTDVLYSISENLLQMTAAEPNQTRNLAQIFKTVCAAFSLQHAFFRFCLD